MRFHFPFSRRASAAHRFAPRLLLLGGLAAGTFFAARADDSPTTITIDTSGTAVTSLSMAGFLHGMDATEPPQEFLTPLKPGLWRAGTLTSQIYTRARAAGASYTVICSDYWGYDPNHRPLDDPDAYVAKMQRIAENTIDHAVIYDIWNEPNISQFFAGSPEEFYETWHMGYDAIRSVRPDAVFAGPSTSGLDETFILGFLDYCAAQGIYLDVLTWHEYRSGSDLAAIAPDTLAFRTQVLTDYADVSIRKTQVNESMNQDVYLNPGSVLATMLSFELGGVEAAGRSGWNEDFLNNFGGLLVPGTYEKRSVWWLYRSYAHTLNDRISTRVRDDGWALTANRRIKKGKSKIRMLIGRYNLGGESGDRDVTIDAQNVTTALGIPSNSSVSVRARLITPSGSDPLDALETSTDNFTLQDTTLEMTYTVPIEGVIELTITPAS